MSSLHLPTEVRAMLAERARRTHHFIWHSVRNSWHAFPVAVRDDLIANGWEPPRPAVNAAGQLDFENDSGEDFLFMHRQMIAHINMSLAVANDSEYPEVVGWDQVPSPNDPDFPVPPPYGIGDGVKTEEFFNRPPNPDGSGGGMKHWDDLLSNDQVLQQISLGRLGSLMEFTIHSWMHMRWSRDTGTTRPDVNANNADTIDSSWDEPTYDWLGDTYSSHVNNHFWKLHGLIDSRIDQWAAANGVADINWIGDWVGKMPPAPNDDDPASESMTAPNVFVRLHETSRLGMLESTEHNHDSSDNLAVMERIVLLIQNCGVHYHFYDRLELDDLTAVED